MSKHTVHTEIFIIDVFFLLIYKNAVFIMFYRLVIQFKGVKLQSSKTIIGKRKPDKHIRKISKEVIRPSSLGSAV